MLVRFIKIALVLISFSTITGCLGPQRGDIRYAAAYPVQFQGPQQNTDSIYQPQTAMLLHEDLRARRVGDMLTVLLEEKTDAEKKSATGTSKSTTATMNDPTLFGDAVTAHGESILDNSIRSNGSFSGSGDTSQSNSLSGSVTVVVVDVLANGNLVVQGEKWMNINQGEDYVRLRGIIRPIDINPDNTIASTRIASADIQYGGDGTLDDANSMGWLARFFNSPWMPF